jgi:long-chain acyl-CoA synthetase
MNVADSFANAALYYPDKKALIFGDASYTYAEMHRIIDGVAAYLRKLGVSKGDRVSLYMANRPEWIMVYFGAARMGAIAVCVPSAYRRDEMKEVVNDSRSSILVTSEALLSLVPPSEAIPLVRQVLVVERDEVFQSILRGDGTCPLAAWPDTTGDDTCAILYTGGTTGVPKGSHADAGTSCTARKMSLITKGWFPKTSDYALCLSTMSSPSAMSCTRSSTAAPPSCSSRDSTWTKWLPRSSVTR